MLIMAESRLFLKYGIKFFSKCQVFISYEEKLDTNCKRNSSHLVKSAGFTSGFSRVCFQFLILYHHRSSKFNHGERFWAFQDNGS